MAAYLYSLIQELPGPSTVVPLSGASASGGAGSVVQTTAPTVSGQHATGGVGNVATQHAFAAPSATATGSVGTVTSSSDPTIRGASGEGSSSAPTETTQRTLAGVNGTGESNALAEPTAVVTGVHSNGVVHPPSMYTTYIQVGGVSGKGHVGSPVESVSEYTTVAGVDGIGNASLQAAPVSSQPVGVYGLGVVGTPVMTGVPAGVSGNGFGGSPIATVGGPVTGRAAQGVAGLLGTTSQLPGAEAPGAGGSVVPSTTSAIVGVLGNGFVAATYEVIVQVPAGVNGTGVAGQASTALTGVSGLGFASTTSETQQVTLAGGQGVGFVNSIAVVTIAGYGVFGSGVAGALPITGSAVGVTAYGAVGNLSETVGANIAGTLAGINAVGSAGSPSTPNQSVFQLDGVSGTGATTSPNGAAVGSVVGVNATGVTHDGFTLSVASLPSGAAGTGIVHVPYLSFTTQMPSGTFGVGWCGTAWPSQEIYAATSTGVAHTPNGAPTGAPIGATAQGFSGVLADSQELTTPGALADGFAGTPLLALPLKLTGATGTGHAEAAISSLPGVIHGVYALGTAEQTFGTAAPYGVSATGSANNETLGESFQPAGALGKGRAGALVVLPAGDVLVAGAYGNGFANPLAPSLVLPGVAASGVVGTAFPTRTGFPGGAIGFGNAGAAVGVPEGVSLGANGFGNATAPYTWPTIFGAAGIGHVGGAAATSIASIYLHFLFSGTSQATLSATGDVDLVSFTTTSTATYSWTAVGTWVLPFGIKGTTQVISLGNFRLPLELTGVATASMTAVGGFTLPLSFGSGAEDVYSASGTILVDFTSSGTGAYYQRTISYPLGQLLGFTLSGVAQSTMSAVGTLTIDLGTTGIANRPLMAELSSQQTADDDRLWVLTPDSRIYALQTDARMFSLSTQGRNYALQPDSRLWELEPV